MVAKKPNVIAGVMNNLRQIEKSTEVDRANDNFRFNDGDEVEIMLNDAKFDNSLGGVIANTPNIPN